VVGPEVHHHLLELAAPVHHAHEPHRHGMATGAPQPVDEGGGIGVLRPPGKRRFEKPRRELAAREGGQSG
jgi:hypothetical protein